MAGRGKYKSDTKNLLNGSTSVGGFQSSAIPNKDNIENEFNNNFSGGGSGGGGGGWNSSPPAKTQNGGWNNNNGNNDNNNSSGGWNNSESDFNNKCNITNNSFNGNKREGGFNQNFDSRGDRPKGCFKCGEEGHMSRDCPKSNASSDRPKGCFKCGEEGHMSRECPNNASSDRPKGCFKCGEEGHMSRDCPSNESDGGPVPEKVTFVSEEFDIEDQVSQMNTGINFKAYKNIKIEMEGTNVPSKISTFEEAHLNELLMASLKKAGYSYPTPVQSGTLPIVLSGRDCVACAQTGSGKTAAFLLPIISNLLEAEDEDSCLKRRIPRALIVGPTRELINQIDKHAKTFCMGTPLKCVVCYGGVAVFQNISTYNNGCDILSATFGRLLDFLRRDRISLENVEYVVLDEADRMLQQNGFKENVEELFGFFTQKPKVLMFSATMPQEIVDVAKTFLNNHIYLKVGLVGGANQDVKQTVMQVSGREKTPKLRSVLENYGDKKVLVFCNRKLQADNLGLTYVDENIWNSFYVCTLHGDRTQEQREAAMKKFRHWKSGCMFATSVAARGLDIPEVHCVVNFDFPDDIDTYIHRIGRTGRAGHQGESITFYDPSVDSRFSAQLVKILSNAEQDVPEFLVGGGGGGDFGGGFGGGNDGSGGGGNGGGGGGGGWDNGGW